MSSCLAITLFHTDRVLIRSQYRICPHRCGHGTSGYKPARKHFCRRVGRQCLGQCASDDERRSLRTVQMCFWVRHRQCSKFATWCPWFGSSRDIPTPRHREWGHGDHHVSEVSRDVGLARRSLHGASLWVLAYFADNR